MCWLRFLRATFLLLPFFLEGIECLRMVSMQVPEQAFQGDEVRLSVEYTLDGDQLYSIKWYKDDMEFYRHVANDKPLQTQYFLLEGVRVDMARSVGGTVYLKDVDYPTAGNYRVEVSADGPSFQTVSGTKHMEVHSWESHKPTNATIFMAAETFSTDNRDTASSCSYVNEFAILLTILVSLRAY